MIKCFSILVLLMGMNTSSMGQGKLLLDNEFILFSFKTKTGKTCMIAHEKTNEEYLVYRYGTADKIELEYPKDKTNSWSKFIYDFYYRGGGKENAGLDLNYLLFTNGGYEYKIYQTYSAEDDTYECGIEVMNLASKKTTKIEGIYFTIQGGLSLLRDAAHRDEIVK